MHTCVFMGYMLVLNKKSPHNKDHHMVYLIKKIKKKNIISSIRFK